MDLNLRILDHAIDASTALTLGSHSDLSTGGAWERCSDLDGSMLGHRLSSTLLSILDMVFWLWSG